MLKKKPVNQEHNTVKTVQKQGIETFLDKQKLRALQEMLKGFL